MFKFLKEKLKNAVSSFSQKVDEEGKEEEIEEVIEEPKEEVKEEPKPEPKEESAKEEIKPEVEKEPVEKEPQEKPKEPVPEEKPKEVQEEETKEEPKKGFFAKLKDTFSKKDEITKTPEDEMEEIPVEKFEKDKKIEKEKEEQIKKEEKKKEVIEKKAEIAEKKVKEKVEKKEIPSLQELAERKAKKKPEPKVEEPVKEEPKPEVKEKPKVDEKIEQEEKLLTKKEKETVAEIHHEKPTNEEVDRVVKSDEELEKESSEEKKVEETKEEKPIEKEEIEEEPKKKSFFDKIKETITTKKISEQQFEDMFWELEVVLLENNVAVEVIEKIKDDLKANVVDQPIARGKIEETIANSLAETIKSLFEVDTFRFLDKVKEKKPFVICFFGINGSGKTTTIAKVANLLKKNKLSVVLAAGDTFRAAAIDQLEQHAKNLGLPIVKQSYGADPAAVAFDAIKSAESRSADVVLIDTAGRMHSNSNLMEEMKKIIRVADPDLKIFVGESITGNDCTEQAKKFNETVGLDGIILSKADIDEKGGSSISVSYVTKKPILFIGTGQEYDDIKEFDPSIILESLGL